MMKHPVSEIDHQKQHLAMLGNGLDNAEKERLKGGIRVTLRQEKTMV